MATRNITVDVDSNAVRVLETKGGRVLSWASAPLAPGLMSDGAVQDAPALGNALRSLMKESGIDGPDVTLSIGGVYSVCRVVQTSVQVGMTLAEAIEQAVPGEGLKLQHQILEADDRGPRALVMGCPTTALESQLEALDSAGLAATAIELKGMALARAANSLFAVIVNVEQDTTDVVVVAEGVPRVMRTLVFRKDDARDETRGRYIARVLDQTMSYYESHHSDHPLPGDVPIFLVGPGSWDPSIAEEVRAQFDNPMPELDPPLEVPAHLSRSEFAVNLGLALRVSPRPSDAQSGPGPVPLYINLAPRKKSPIKISRELASALGGIVVGLGLLYLIFGQVAAASDETQKLRDRFAPIENSVNARREELNRTSEMEAAISEFENLTAPWGQVTQIWDYLQVTVPPDLSMTSLSVLPNRVSISLSSERIDQAIDFVEVLRAASWNVDYPRPTPVIEASINPANLQGE